MQVQELPREKLHAIAASTSAEYVRSPGVHVTDLTSLVMMGIDPDKYGTPDAPKMYDEFDTQNWQQAGFVWEEVLTSIFSRRRLHAGVQHYTYLGRTGEVKLDGVIGSPDGFVMDPDGLALTESKQTWMSRRGFDLDSAKFIAWKFQILAYLRMVELTRCYLAVFWVNGTYDRYVPEFVEYRLTFTAREIEENWTMLLNTGKRHGLLAA